jgi:hypothetical protein
MGGHACKFHFGFTPRSAARRDANDDASLESNGQPVLKGDVAFILAQKINLPARAAGRIHHNIQPSFHADCNDVVILTGQAGF